MEFTQTQLKYPLSSRKFWKKIVSRSVITTILVFVMSAMGFILLIGSIPQSESLPAGYTAISAIAALLFFIGILCLLHLLPYGWYVNYYIQKYYYSLDENFITIRKGVFTPSEIHVQYQKIQDVYVDQDIFDRIFGIYDVHIASATASSSIEAHIDGLSASHAEALKNEILERIQKPNQAMAATPGQQSQSQTDPAIIAKLTSGISSLAYPINSRWLISVVATTLWRIVAFMLVASFYFILSYFQKETEVATDANGQYLPIFWLVYAAILLVTGIFRLGYSIWWKSNYYFEFQPEYIVLKQGVISTEERHIQYSSIQNVTLKQKITDRIFGICDVVIENAAAGGGGISVNSIGKLGMGITGSNGIIIPGQLLADGKKLVEIVNSIAVEKNATPNNNGL